jgi:putative acetyltransferase
MNLIQATSPDEITSARQLFQEYAAWIGIDLCFQNFARELATLPGEYVSPAGRLFLVSIDDQIAGCVALRRLDDETCEMKRLFVRPQYQGRRLGRELAERVIKEARQIGYQRMRLDTLPGVMDRAIAMYESLGFKDIAPYYNNPVAGAKFMELSLR